MKKLFLFLLPLTIWSCNKGEVSTTENNDTPSEVSEKLIDVAFTAVGENVSDADEQTKVHFQDLTSYSQLWEQGNEVAVYSAQGTKTSISVSAAYNNGHADFSGQVGESSPYNLIYPNDAANSIEGTTITATLPAVQTAGEYGTDPAALVSVAYAENLSSVSFYNAFALIQFTLEDTGVTSVMIEGANGEKIAGEFTVDTNSQTPVATPTENSSTVVVLKPSDDTFAAGTYAVAVFPQTFEKGFRVIYKKSGTKKCSVKSVKSNIELSRNTARHYSHDKLYPGDYKYYYLLDADDLITWAKDNANYATTDVVYLMRDIALTAEQAAKYVEAHNFYGEFNGNDHEISGLKTPLFGNLESAYVHNLQLRATIVANGKQASPFKGTDYGVGILAHYAYKTGHTAAGTRANPKIENITTYGSIEVKDLNVAHNFMFGGVIGASNGVPVTNCENNATVTFTSGTTGTSASTTMNMGGVIGAAQDAATANLTRCVNKGKVTLAGFSGAGSPVAAGCVGVITQAVQIKDCSNEAEVEVASTVGNISFIAAGLAGNFTGAATVDGCENSGAVNVNAPAGKYLVIGGLVGSLKPDAAVVKNSENKNTGVITVKTNATNRVDIGGVIAYTGTTNMKGGYYAQNLKNYGNIEVSGVAGTSGASGDQFRIGGIIGNLSYGGTVGKDKSGNDTPCYNYANITLSSPLTKDFRVAGGIGSTTSVAANVYNIHNTGNISVTITEDKTCVQADCGGIVGYLGTGPFNIANCSSNCDIVKTGSVTTQNFAAILGRSGTGNNNNTIDSCKIGGTVNGTTITDANKNTLVYKAKSGAIAVTNITLAE